MLFRSVRAFVCVCVFVFVWFHDRAYKLYAFVAAGVSGGCADRGAELSHRGLALASIWLTPGCQLDPAPARRVLLLSSSLAVDVIRGRGGKFK